MIPPTFAPIWVYSISINENSIIAIAQTEVLGVIFFFLFLINYMLSPQNPTHPTSRIYKEYTKYIYNSSQITTFNVTTGLQCLSVTVASITLI